jgi:hypothetical protein
MSREPRDEEFDHDAPTWQAVAALAIAVVLALGLVFVALWVIP